MRYRRLDIDPTQLVSMLEVCTESSDDSIGAIAKRVEDPEVWWIVAPRDADPGPYVKRIDAALELLAHSNRKRRRRA